MAIPIHTKLKSVSIKARHSLFSFVLYISILSSQFSTKKHLLLTSSIQILLYNVSLRLHLLSWMTPLSSHRQLKVSHKCWLSHKNSMKWTIQKLISIRLILFVTDLLPTSTLGFQKNLNHTTSHPVILILHAHLFHTTHHLDFLESGLRLLVITTLLKNNV